MRLSRLHCKEYRADGLGRAACALAILLLLAAAWGCGSPQAGSGGGSLEFTGTGLCVTGVEIGVPIIRVSVSDGGSGVESGFRRFGGALLIPFAWRAGESYAVDVAYERSGRAQHVEGRAPLNPGTVLLRTIGLEGLLGGAEPGGLAPQPTAAAVSGDGRWGAVGTDSGRIILFDLEDGNPAAQLYSAGAYIRSLEFAEAGAGTRLLAGEQSPRGTIAAYRVEAGGALSKLWSHETAAEIGSSSRDPADPYSWAHLPGIYRIVCRGGRVFALAVHPPEGGETRARSLLYCFEGSTGRELWRWPEAGTLGAVATWFDADLGGARLALCAYDRRSGNGAAYALDGASGEQIGRLDIAPLRPHLEQVNFWHSIAISPDGGRVGLIADDGRAWLWHPGGETREIALGEPLQAGGIPLLISGAGVWCGPEETLFATGTSYLPWQLSGGRRPPQPHPDALKLIAVDAGGGIAWAATIPNLPQGLAASADWQWIHIGYASDPVFSPAGGSGLASYSLKRPQAPLAASFPVGGAVMHGSPALAPGGHLVLLVERSQRDASGERLRGRNALHLLLW